MKEIKLRKIISNVHTGDAIEYTVKFKKEGFYSVPNNSQTYGGKDMTATMTVNGNQTTLPFFKDISEVKDKGVVVTIDGKDYSVDNADRCTYGGSAPYGGKYWTASYTEDGETKKAGPVFCEINEISSKTKYLLEESLTLDMFNKTRWNLMKFENYDSTIDSYIVKIGNTDITNTDDVELDENGLLSINKTINGQDVFTVNIILTRLKKSTEEGDDYNFGITTTYNDTKPKVFDFTTLNNDMKLSSDTNGNSIVSDSTSVTDGSLVTPAITFNYDATIYQNSSYKTSGVFYLFMNKDVGDLKITHSGGSTDRFYRNNISISKGEYNETGEYYPLTFSMTDSSNSTKTDFTVTFSAKGYNDLTITVRQKAVVYASFNFAPTSVETSVTYANRSSFGPISFDGAEVTTNGSTKGLVLAFSAISYTLNSVKNGNVSVSGWKLDTINGRTTLSSLSYSGSNLSAGTTYSYTVSVTAEWNPSDAMRHTYSFSGTRITSSFTLTVVVGKNTSGGGSGGSLTPITTPKIDIQVDDDGTRTSSKINIVE
jgi:hypothetical protein